MAQDTRPSWDEYFMQIADVAATRSTCLRRHVGAVLVHDRHILATGYNGVPAGIEHCLTRGCLREELGIPSGQYKRALEVISGIGNIQIEEVDQNVQ